MDQSVNLCGARVALGRAKAADVDLSIDRGRVWFGAQPGGRRFDLSGYLLLPGLINAHDHLELNLFPRLGQGPYRNARLWAEDIYHPDEPPARQHRRVPKHVRLLWGGIKNLLSGVTTVAHHNPYVASSFDTGFPVRVVKRYGYAHSLTFAPDWKERFAQTLAGVPFIIHAAEGTDEESRAELRTLDSAGALRSNTLIVHGVALNEGDAALLRKRNASLIWCPSSNLFTLGRTVSKAMLNAGVPVALGTDSALTAAGDLLDELRTASEFVDTARLFEMVTSVPARMLRLKPGAGRIEHGVAADLVIVRNPGGPSADTLLNMRPEAVFIGGELRLVSLELAAQLRFPGIEHFEQIDVKGRGAWLLPFPVRDLIEQARHALGHSPMLAGKAVAA